MGSERSSPSTRARSDDGFTVVEGLVAVTVLAIAIVLSIQPLTAALRGVSDARIITVAENLAQAEIEAIRSLDYTEVGLPGLTPEGSLTPSREIVVEGRTFTIDVEVRYVGSVTGLDVIPQGGDGVEGAWDPGVDYKMATVTVVVSGRELDPVVMETIISPTMIGQHENIANAKVVLDAHEPFRPSNMQLPTLEIHAPPEPPIGSGMATSEQIWPAIPQGSYTVYVQASNGWIIHPEDVLKNLDQLQVVNGTLAETTLRVFRPAVLNVDVRDADTNNQVPNARITLTDADLGDATTFIPGEYVITSLMPDTYDVLVTAPNYADWSVTSIDIPSAYPSPNHNLTVYLTPVDGPATTTTSTIDPTSSSTSTLPQHVPVEFVVLDHAGDAVAGASVTVSHPEDGSSTGITDRFGRIGFNILDGLPYSAAATTPWGHGTVSATVDGSNPVETLQFDFQAGYGLVKLTGGEHAEFVYRPAANEDWKAMRVNHAFTASFSSPNDKWQVAKRCLGNGEVEGISNVRSRKDTIIIVAVPGWCPTS